MLTWPEKPIEQTLGCHAPWHLDVLEPVKAIECWFLPSSYFEWVVEVRDRLEDAGR